MPANNNLSFGCSKPISVPIIITESPAAVKEKVNRSPGFMQKELTNEVHRSALLDLIGMWLQAFAPQTAEQPVCLHIPLRTDRIRYGISAADGDAVSFCGADVEDAPGVGSLHNVRGNAVFIQRNPVTFLISGRFYQIMIVRNKQLLPSFCRSGYRQLAVERARVSPLPMVTSSP